MAVTASPAPAGRALSSSLPTTSGGGRYDQVPWAGPCGRALQYWEPLEAAAKVAGANPEFMGALLVVENSGERAISPAGAMGLMQLLPDKFQPGDDPFHAPTNLLRAAQHIAGLQARHGSGDRVAAAYFGAIDADGNVTGASDGNVSGFEYVRRFQAALACVRTGLGVPGEAVPNLVSPIGTPISPANISFGFLDDYGAALASYIRGPEGVRRYGTRHLAWDLIVPGAPKNGRGSPIFAPLAGRIIRTSDPVGGPFGIWLENSSLNLRARLMHMDGLAPGIETGAQVRAGQVLGVLGGQGTEDFPHLHLSLELLSSGERLDPARFYFRSGTRSLPIIANGQLTNGPAPGAVTDLSGDRFLSFRIPDVGIIGEPRAWGSTVVWTADEANGRGLLGYDLDLGWSFRVGSPAARGLSAPVISGDTVAWLDTRNVGMDREPGDARGTADLADVYSYDLMTGEERRLTTTPGHYSDLAISGPRVAWVNRDRAESRVEVHHLLTDSLTVVDRSAGQLGELSMSGPLLVWTERPSGAPVEAGGDVRGYNVETGQLLQLHQGGASQPTAAGATVFWQEQVGPGPERLIRARDIAADQERTLTTAPAPRRGLRAADYMLLWEEPTPDGRRELRSYGLSSGEMLKLTDRPAGAADAAIGRGTVVWRDGAGDLAVIELLDWDVGDGHFYAERGGERAWAGRLGYSVTNEGGIPLWDEYRRLGGPAVLGRPLSGRIEFGDGLVYLLTERTLLQWRPDSGRLVPANSLEILEQIGHNQLLHDRWQVPHSVVEDGAGGDWAQSRAVRLGWLTDPLIREKYLANPDPARFTSWSEDDAIALYGLPMSEPENFGPFVAQRFQRAVLQRWTTDGPAQPRRDSVTIVRIGAIFRQLVLEQQEIAVE